MIRDTPDSAFLEFDINQTPVPTEKNAYEKAKSILNNLKSTLMQKSP